MVIELRRLEERIDTLETELRAVKTLSIGGGPSLRIAEGAHPDPDSLKNYIVAETAVLGTSQFAARMDDIPGLPIYDNTLLFDVGEGGIYVNPGDGLHDDGSALAVNCNPDHFSFSAGVLNLDTSNVVNKLHTRLHGIDDVADHNGVALATLDNVMVFDANGLPYDAALAGGATNIGGIEWDATGVRLIDGFDGDGLAFAGGASGKDILNLDIVTDYGLHLPAGQLSIEIDPNGGLDADADGLQLASTVAGNGIDLSAGGVLSVDLDDPGSALSVGVNGIKVASSIAGDGLSITTGVMAVDLKTSGGLKITSGELEIDDTELASRVQSLLDAGTIILKCGASNPTQVTDGSNTGDLQDVFKVISDGGGTAQCLVA